MKKAMEEAVEGLQVSPLLRLPAELRNRIWHCALQQKHYLKDQSVLAEYWFLNSDRCAQSASLLRVCHQTRIDVTPMFYTHTVFKFHYLDLAISWLMSLDALSRGHLAKVRILPHRLIRPTTLEDTKPRYRKGYRPPRPRTYDITEPMSLQLGSSGAYMKLAASGCPVPYGSLQFLHQLYHSNLQGWTNDPLRGSEGLTDTRETKDGYYARPTEFVP